MGEYIVEYLGEGLPFCAGIAIFILIQVAAFTVKYSRKKLKILFAYGRGKLAIIATYLLILCGVIVLLFVHDLELWLLIFLYMVYYAFFT